MDSRSRTTLFLMEQLIVIAVFAICSAICVSILAGSYSMVSYSSDVSNAAHVAKSAAECFKAMSGDIEKTVETLGSGDIQADSAMIYYDTNWSVCGAEGASYILTFKQLEPSADSPVSPNLCEVSVSKSGGDNLISLTVAARRSFG